MKWPSSSRRILFFFVQIVGVLVLLTNLTAIYAQDTTTPVEQAPSTEPVPSTQTAETVPSTAVTGPEPAPPSAADISEATQVTQPAVQTPSTSQTIPAPATEAPKISDQKLKGVDQTTRRELSDEEIQQKLFKKQGDSPPTVVYIPVFYERMDRALVRLKSRITQSLKGMSIEVDAKAMFIILEQLAVDSWLNKHADLRARCKNFSESKTEDKSEDNTCWSPLSQIADNDVKIDFNESALEVRIHIPPDLRTTKKSSLFLLSNAELDDVTDHPRWFSSYVNMNFNQTFRSDQTALKNGREPFLGQFDSGTRFGPIVVIDAKARYVEKIDQVEMKASPFEREDVRAVFNFEKSMLRSQVGDLVFPVKGFQAYRPMGGAAIFSQFSLQPSTVTLPGGDYEIFLARPSKVTAYLNGQAIQTLDLPAGRHNLRDFPFASGLNDIRLEIVDDMGRIETQEYSYFSNNELLKPGLHEVSYAAGSPWSDETGERVYDSEQSTYSASHRYGFTQNFTMGANYQQDPIQSVAGLEFMVSTPIGYFSLEPAYSTNKDQEDGHAARLRYISQKYLGKERSNQFTILEATTWSKTFAILGTPLQTNPTETRVQATHTRAIAKATNLNLSLGYQFNRNINNRQEDSYNFSIGASRRWADGLTTNINLRHSKTIGGTESISIMGFLVWAFPKERQFITASHDSAANGSRADWTYQPSSGVGGFTAQVNTQKKDTGDGYGGSLDYIANRARFNVNEQIEVPTPDETETTSNVRGNESVKITTLRMGTAVVFAGGHFGLSRPVSDSFVLLNPLENLKNQHAQINPQSDGTFVAQTDSFGPAVDPELPSYSTTSVVVGQKNLAPGTTLPRDHFFIRPPYHSGYAIDIGSDATVYLKVLLLQPDGKPLEMGVAMAYYLTDTTKEPVTVFTNRQGLLRSEGFRHGKYRLEISDSDLAPVEFEIPSSAGVEYDMGQLKLQKKQQ